MYELFGTWPEPTPDAPFEGDRCDTVIEVAEAAGAGAFLGLDVYVEVIRSGWRPFPVRRAEED